MKQVALLISAAKHNLGVPLSVGYACKTGKEDSRDYRECSEAEGSHSVALFVEHGVGAHHGGETALLGKDIARATASGFRESLVPETHALLLAH